jgi:hypothetical protein
MDRLSHPDPIIRDRARTKFLKSVREGRNIERSKQEAELLKDMEAGHQMISKSNYLKYVDDKKAQDKKDHLGRLVPTNVFGEIPKLGLVKAGLPSDVEEIQDSIIFKPPERINNYATIFGESLDKWLREQSDRNKTDLCVVQGGRRRKKTRRRKSRRHKTRRHKTRNYKHY